MVRRIGLELTQSITQSREGFVYEGQQYNIDIANPGPDLVKVANESYVKGEREPINENLQPGEQKEFARIEVRPGEFILLLTTSATPHPTTEYQYYIDGEEQPDPNLSGNAPWASPPNEYEVRRRGFRIVDNSVSLQISESTGERSYSEVEGWLTGIVVERRL